MDTYKEKLKQALIAIKTLKNKVQQKEEKEPIAIIGMGCRFPGGVIDINSYCKLLEEEKDAIIEVPSNRWKLEDWFSDQKSVEGKMYSKWGGFLPDIDLFDAEFFGISPREAIYTDPQQRIFLETAWEALEQAGYTKKELQDSNTGVYLGVYANDYHTKVMKNASHVGAHSFVSSLGSAISGRLSYWLGLKGPNMVIDTACSSSLVAIHTAVKSLQNKECKIAIAGGVNIILNPENTVGLSKIEGLSPTGRCQTFSAKADGFVRSEGAGALVLKPLSQAQHDGDTIVGVIKGSAVNQDGQSQGFTAPSGNAQREVIYKALADAGLSPDDIDYIETHGTGTVLGDAIELDSIVNVFGNRDKASSLYVGSVKTNIGHTESAAGVAGVIKTILCLNRQSLYRTLHLDTLNTHVDWDSSAIKVVENTIPWKKEKNKTRRAGISSFGISGTNSHIIIEEPPQNDKEQIKTEKTEVGLYHIPFSADKKEALIQQKKRLYEYLQIHVDIELQDIAHTLSCRKDHFMYRSILQVGTIEELKSTLKYQVEQKEEFFVDEAIDINNPVFLFTGLGSQFSEMGKTIYNTEPVFRETFDLCCSLAVPYLEKELKEVVFNKKYESLLKELDYMQPALFAFQFAMSALWQSWGVTPKYLLGHSLGEIVAACVANVFTLEDGVKLVCHRGRLMQKHSEKGSMLSVKLSPDEVKKLFNKNEPSISIGVVNGKKQTVLSGKTDEILRVKKWCDDKEIKSKLLNISRACHSSLMDPVLDEFREVLDTITFFKPTYSILSNLTGEITGGDIASSAYWVDHLRQTVQFSKCVHTIEKLGANTFIEMGPKPIVLGIIGQEIDSKENNLWLPSSREEDGDTVYKSLAKWYTNRGEVDWNSLYEKGKHVYLPTYPFQRSSYWYSEQQTADSALIESKKTLLGNYFEGANHWIYQNHIDFEKFPFLITVQNRTTNIASESLILEILQEFMCHQKLQKNTIVEQLQIHHPLLFQNKKGQIQLIVRKTDQAYSFLFYSKKTNESDWVENASGTLIMSEKKSDVVNIENLQTSFDQPYDINEYNSSLQRLKDVPDTLLKVEKLWIDEHHVLAQIQLSETVDFYSQSFQIHPIILKETFHLISILMEDQGELDQFPVFSIGTFETYKEVCEKEIWIKIRKIAKTTDAKEMFAVDIRNHKGVGLVSMGAVEKESFSLKNYSDAIEVDWRYNLDWKPIDLATYQERTINKLLIFGDPSAHTKLINELSKKGNSIFYATQLEDVEEIVQEMSIDTVLVLWKPSINKEPVGVIKEQMPEAVAMLQQYISWTKSKAFPLLKNIYWITQNTQPFTSHTIDLAKATIWGEATVFTNERPDIPLVLMDISEQEDNNKMISQVISKDLLEKELIIKDQQVFGKRLTKRKDKNKKEHFIATAACTVMITGGCKGIGLLTAEWFVKKHTIKHLILLGRSTPDSYAKEKIEALRQLGTMVTIAIADVTDQVALSEVIEEIPEEFPLKGIVHSAGVTRAKTVENQIIEEVLSDMAPKIQGAWYLHELTKGMDLDFFICYSSAASVMDVLGVGQGSYVAANTFLDHFAYYRNQQHLPTYSINWSPWESTGMAKSLTEKEKKRLKALGFINIHKNEGIKILEEIGNSEAGQYPVLKFDPTLLLKYYDGIEISSVYKELTDAQQSKTDKLNDVNLLDTIRGKKPKAQKQLIKEVIKDNIARILSLASKDVVDTRKSLFKQGLDSLMMVELKNRITKQLAINLSLSEVLNIPNIEELTTVIVENYLGIEEQEIISDDVVIDDKVTVTKVPLSSMQERLWFIYKLTGINQLHNIYFELFYNGNLCLTTLAETIQYLVDRHEALRSVIKENKKGAAFVEVKSKSGYQIPFNDFSEYSEKEKTKAAEKLRKKRMKYSFDFSEETMHFEVVKLEEDVYKLMVTQHHLFSDGWSIIVLLKEIIKVYDALQAKRTPQLGKVIRNYEELVVTEKSKIKSGDFDTDLAYWREYLSDAPLLKLPTDYSYPEKRGYQGGNIELLLSKPLSKKIDTFIKKEGVTLNTILFGAYTLMLHYFSNQDDFVIGSGMANRNEEGFENVLGYFANTIAIRCKIKSEETLLAFLERQRASIFNCLPYHEVPFNLVVKEVLKSRSKDNTIDNPLCNVSFVVNSFDLSELYAVKSDWLFKGLNLGIEGIATDDLNMIMMRSKNDIQGIINYNSEIFDKKTIEHLISLYKSIVTAIVTDPYQTINSICLVDKQHIEGALKSNNNPSVKYPKKKTLIALFREQQAKTPNAIAVTYKDQVLTYKELQKKSLQVANYLVTKENIQSGDTVAILAQRGVDMIVSILGVLQCGATYVPLHTEYPVSRLQYIIEDSNVKTILCTDEKLILEKQLSSYPYFLIEETQSFQDTPLDSSSTPSSIAYIMYTSGTTGTPKGVRVSHQNIMKLVHDTGAIQVLPEDHVLQWSNFAFDGSTYEIFSTLLTGARLVMITEEDAPNVIRLADEIKKKEITVCFVTTALFNALIDYDTQSLSGIRKILFGGELVSVPHVKKAFDTLGKGKIVHVYGPTETVVYATSYEVNKVEKDSVPIGKPLDNTTVYIFNKGMQLCPTGVIGELYIGGDGVANGYLNKPELTTERFVSNPFDTHKNATLYKTGDMVRWLPGGDIEFIGRKDDQVKIRGYRIELGEIETTFKKSSYIKQALVVAQEDPGGSKRLVSYIIPDKGYTKELLIQELQLQLPDYMIPPFIISLESYPLTPNGKINKRELPDPLAVDEKLTSDKNTTAIIVNETTVEKVLEIWKKVLNIDTISIEDDFFELGGHSLLGTQIIAEIKEVFDIEISLGDLFSEGTVKNLVALIEAATAGETTEEKTIEGTLLEIWKKVLNIDTISIEDDFFELGGHSLLGTQIIAEIKESLGVEVSLGDLFSTGTVTNLVAVIQSQLSSTKKNTTILKIAEIWKKVLNVDTISEDDDFFELGGHSLLGTQIIAEIKETLGVEISLGDLFSASTVKNIATLVDARLSQEQSAIDTLQVL
ncbi:hybrid non-ribosomal peptide synthetase/type I polyketide synthase [Aquimarina aquimarini]|uniref:hybrid non-ribosomal peptide synthetase/type I polyketide synthase n=1 Tax=Aquimarina aquimarini TaxID=1191734 RepID=UPI000D54C22D|nr:hybrid non-ribosomal peptide synthetase/type I polyketide synthase [Aquimarina aquimarini]